MTDRLLVKEIYRSLQGESSLAGWPCIFVRLTGCNLRCSYCDSAYAFTGGTSMGVDEVLERVHQLSAPVASSIGKPRRPLVELTGGEPLLQPAARPLMVRLGDAGFQVLLETSGALDIGGIDSRVARIVDLKCPSSGECDRNLWSNVDLLRPTDELKFVMGTAEDYEWAKATLETHRLAERCTVLFSWVEPLTARQRHASLKAVPPGQTPMIRQALAERVIADRLPVRFQLQMHKFIWPPDRQGV
jgi:7-carboxy-7-deazaguanine synthase